MTAATFRARLQAWSHGLSSRERILLLGVMLAALGFLSDVWLWESQKKKTQALQAQWLAQRDKLSAPLPPLAQAPSPDQEDPLATRRTQLSALREDIGYARSLIESAQRDAHVGTMARTVIAQARGVTLRGLQTRQPQSFYQPPTPTARAAAQPLPHLYLHAIEISVDGRYDDIVQFLQRLESQDKSVFWPSAVVSVTTPPFVNLRATVQMLSISPDAPLQ